MEITRIYSVEAYEDQQVFLLDSLRKTVDAEWFSII